MGQKPQNDLYEGGKKLPLVEAFYTIQGEGQHTGKAAFFIRIGGCDVGCSWCDTKFSWNPEIHPLVEIEEIIEKIIESGADSVVVTGGEPLAYNLDKLCNLFRENRLKIFLETSGAYPLSGDWDWICLSPKQNLPPDKCIFHEADELKMIIQTKSDFAWAEKNAGRAGKSCKLFLQPEWSQFENIIPLVVDYVKTNPKWNISLQVHKFMHIP
ncbi:MAG: 7-carboxy-7-deazaguanine synthase QueE [Bacteroidota bacterium]|nr:7-carboxy-7-deazaguanine synthase QueE [Bacteroidota bacterium]